MPITSNVNPEPRTPATQAEDGVTGGCFARGVREDFGAEDPGFAPGRFEATDDEVAGFDAGFFAADGVEALDVAAAGFEDSDFEDPGFEDPDFEAVESGVSAAAGRRGALPGAEGRRGGRAMGGCLLERWNG
ncbi:hypothetical protein [Rathayibacter sp. PhB127]|uniref:hypothetical protein n=1 Tax=Rathayibacter sp. PhB127 TaxID=2485176 RepID=UPI00161449C9|nr:hypothetical protein [Rathayibacter sp. PhB127]